MTPPGCISLHDTAAQLHRSYNSIAQRASRGYFGPRIWREGRVYLSADTVAAAVALHRARAAFRAEAAHHCAS